MLAQNFKTPSQLRITDEQHHALITVLFALERGELTHVAVDTPEKDQPAQAFNMMEWGCGSIACIGGWAERLCGVKFEPCLIPKPLDQLFYPDSYSEYVGERMDKITTAQGAAALREYLANGRVNWRRVLKTA